MTAEEEIRKVAEDMRELMRALRSEMRAARQRADTHRASTAWTPPRSSARRDWTRPPWEPPPTWSPPPPSPPAAPAVAAPTRHRRGRSERPPVRHRRDGSTLLSVLLVIVGLAWLGSESGTFPISTEAVLATVLVLLGAAMVVTARTDWALSRRSWPVLVGAAVLVALLASSSGGSDLRVGPQDLQLTSWADAATAIHNFAGPTTVDLTALRPAAGDRSEVLKVSATAGPIDVTVPAQPGYHLHVHARSQFGPVKIGAQRTRSGPFAERVADYSPGLNPTLDVEITSRAGPITVHVAEGP